MTPKSRLLQSCEAFLRAIPWAGQGASWGDWVDDVAALRDAVDNNDAVELSKAAKRVCEWKINGSAGPFVEMREMQKYMRQDSAAFDAARGQEEGEANGR